MAEDVKDWKKKLTNEEKLFLTNIFRFFTQGDIDVALPDGCGDDDYLAALEQALQALEDRFNPGFVLYLAGADPFERDRLGRLKLTFDGLQARDRRVFDWCHRRKIPMAFAMGGGYGHDIAETVQVQVNTYRVALEYWRRWQAMASAPALARL